jgi:Amt family ammonium transporter
VFGYSVAFTEGSNAFFGGFSKVFLKGMTGDSLTGTFSKATEHPRARVLLLPGDRSRRSRPR